MKASKTISVLVLLIGVLLVVAPFAYKMFDRAPAGAEMMKDFEPVMTQANVDKFNGYMQGFAGMQEDINNMMPALEQMGMTQEQFGAQYPKLAAGIGQMDVMGKDFQTVVTVMDNNIENYDKANKLPMKTMPWFFVIPGAVLIVLAAIQLRTK